MAFGFTASASVRALFVSEMMTKVLKCIAMRNPFENKETDASG